MRGSPSGIGPMVTDRRRGTAVLLSFSDGGRDSAGDGGVTVELVDSGSRTGFLTVAGGAEFANSDLGTGFEMAGVGSEVAD